MANDYKKLAAIVESTQRGRHKREHPLYLEIGNEGEGMWLRITQQNKTLASVPYELGQEDAAARDLARRLTLDGTLPDGMA